MSCSANATGAPSRIDFLGLPVDALDADHLYERVLYYARQGSGARIVYVNAHCFVLAQQDQEYRHILQEADVVYADGMSVVWGARILGHRLPGRPTATEHMVEFGRRFAAEGIRLYLLGAEPGVAEEAAARLRASAPGLRIVGTHHGYVKGDRSVVDRVKDAHPDILVLGMGVPFQEKWMSEHAQSLEVPVIWAVGGLFDYLCGRWKRGPRILSDHGFEWVSRLCSEPRRLWKRYLIGNSKFAWYILKGALLDGRRR